jgi:hypothetical protein
MKYTQETQARDLYDKLLGVLTSFFPDASISVSGVGVHWECSAIYRIRGCKIHCFGEEYYVLFNYESQTIARGRTSEQGEAISAVKNWLGGDDFADLYKQFDFVDKRKRSLETISLEMIEYCPNLKKCNPHLHSQGGDFYKLQFNKNNRECCVFFYGKNEIPDSTFYWDAVELFQVQTNNYKQLALAIKSWLYDDAMPSGLGKEFPWINIGKLARYYEEGRGVEGEFILSWESVESFYDWANHPEKAEILDFISKIKAQGYEKTLRAGQSLYSLMLSRARRHGLRQDQHYLAFDFRESGMDVRASLVEDKTIHFPQYELAPSLDTLLKQLESMEID